MRVKFVRIRPDPRWKSAVWVRVTTGKTQPVRCPEEALKRLVHQWPRPHARHFRSAITNCEAAISGQFSAELAREAFVRACMEASCLVHGLDSSLPVATHRSVRVPARDASVLVGA
jgi:hypothetical protein